LKYYKKAKQTPVFDKTPNTKYLHESESDSILDSINSIGDVVIKRGKDLRSGKNLSDYWKNGKFDHIKFWLNHQKLFHKLWSLSLEKALTNPTDFSCETLFSESGYASNSHCSKLKSTQFEREVILAHNLQHVFFDVEHEVDIFLRGSVTGLE
jgi:hypothetical protein